MAYGTPRNTAEIEPYYTDIRRGRPPSAEQLAELTGRYAAIGGLSPLHERTEAQRDAIAAALEERAPGRFVVELGMRHAAPSIERGVDALAARNVDRIVGLVLAPHYSTMSVAMYLERAAGAAAARGIGFVGIERWGLLDAYVAFLAGRVRDAVATMPVNTKVVFTAHSLPTRILATGDPYPHEVRATASAVAVAAGLGRWSGWSAAWQSAGRTAGRVARPRHPRGHRRPRAGRARRRAVGLSLWVRGRPPRGALRPRRPGRASAPRRPGWCSPAPRS